jgi:dGTPase
MDIRRTYEEWETAFLSPFATKSIDSRGRKMPEEPCPIRTEFQRDRDRIIHSKAFRRLKHKTQVFISPEGDHYRTRLTHTLEVSQIARTVARALRLNEDLTEAIALGHDLGHTPFGHAGEIMLNGIFPEGFTHNGQSLRVVDVLEDGKGLNLTFEVRDGILNHSGDYKPSTLEGAIVKISDRIAYINHDIEDAVRGEIIRETDLPPMATLILGETKKQRINKMVMDLIQSSYQKDEITFSPDVGWAVDCLRSFMFSHVYVGSAAKTEEDKAKEMLRQLYIYFSKHPSEMPDEFYKSVRDESIERRVCDYLSGMTDRYVIALYKDIFLPKPWLQG